MNFSALPCQTPDMHLSSTSSRLVHLTSASRANIQQPNAFHHPRLRRLSNKTSFHLGNLIQLRSQKENIVPALALADQLHDGKTSIPKKPRSGVYTLTQDEEHEHDLEVEVDEAGKDLTSVCAFAGVNRALDVQFSPRIQSTKRTKEPFPEVFQLGVCTIIPHFENDEVTPATPLSFTSIDTADLIPDCEPLPLRGFKRALNIQFSPRIQLTTRTKVPLPEVVQLGPQNIAPLFSDHHVSSSPANFLLAADKQRERCTRTDGLRLWLAYVLICHLLRHDKACPLPSSLLSATAIDRLANIFNFFLDGYRGPDELVFLAIYYTSYLLPNGLLDAQDLFSSDGIVVATRLFVLTYTLAIKSFEDWSINLDLSKRVSQIPTFFHPYSAIQLETSALQAFDYNIFLQHSSWIEHLEGLSDWTAEPSSHLQDVDLVSIRQLLTTAAEGLASMERTSYRPISPLPSSIDKVHARLLAGLDMAVYCKSTTSDFGS